MRTYLPFLLAVLLVAPLRAQSDPRLVEAVRTAQEGRSDSARATVQRLLAATPATDTLYAEILYTQAMVAGEAADMRKSLQRVAVEYPASSWADDALLRLVQMDYATRSLEPAARNLEKLKADYPDSPLLPQASYWAARIYFDQKNPTAACRWLADGIAQAQSNLELQNQLGYLYQRCDFKTADSATAGAVPSGPDTAQKPPAPVAPKDTTRARFRVQISAVGTSAAADEVAGKVEKLGYPAVIVKERGLYKVRAGAFPNREAAQAAVGKLKASLGGSPFVVAEP
jgi:tetratricopeptide (TPR) repeat protein